MPHSSRTVIVTGGSKGIGAFISRAFHANGDHVVVASRSDSNLAAQLGERARFVTCDVCRPADLRAAAQTALDWTGRLDVFVNNAGYSAWRPLEAADEDFWDRVIGTNLKGVFFGCQAAAVHLPRGGCIINVSSLAGKRGSANNSVYCASKFGVNGITQALAKELGPRGIRVNAVCPVYVQTQGLLEALSQPQAPPLGQETQAYLKSFAASQAALGRLPLGEEIAQVCLFLASPAGSAITGQCINVDCGVLPG
jgi:3-oxoacyl-[acyl-carrier protein] reductase/meso-butanediol dehydrogenase/(S,S)-butanediol dehydrogenase/diacetyl reductase